jgi:hypothetical protein
MDGRASQVDSNVCEISLPDLPAKRCWMKFDKVSLNGVPLKDIV